MYDAATIFDTSNYEIELSLPIGISKKVIQIMKEELNMETMKALFERKLKIYGSLKQKVILKKQKE